MKRMLLLLCILSTQLKCQIDSAMAVPLIGINLAGQLPYGDLAQRFGANLKTGGSILYKTKSNWLFGADAGYFFGRNVKEDVLGQLLNDENFLIDNEGYPADVRVTERGLTVHAQVGRLFPLKNDGPNSGILLCLGSGYMQHKINLYDAQQKVAAIRGELEKGYDLLSAGWSNSLFLGYMHLGENQLLNYYVGFELYQGFTKNVRGINFATGMADTKNRFDLLAGLRLGWILPLYHRTPNNLYYN